MAKENEFVGVDEKFIPKGKDNKENDNKNQEEPKVKGLSKDPSKLAKKVLVGRFVFLGIMIVLMIVMLVVFFVMMGNAKNSFDQVREEQGQTMDDMKESYDNMVEDLREEYNSKKEL